MSALRQSDVDVPVGENDEVYEQWSAMIHNIELERRLKAMSITLWEYKRRVAVQLKWNKIGTTTEEDLDNLLSLSSSDILDALESLWDIQDGKFQWWKVQGGESMSRIKWFALPILHK